MSGTVLIALVGAAALSALWVGLVLGAWSRARRERARAARSRRRGRRGEARGLTLLARAGYRVVDTQAVAKVTVEVDGQAHTFDVRADAIVARRGRRWVAEIKAGDATASVAHRHTRRQLLEYAHAFDVHGVLLVDVPARRVREVIFRRSSS